MKLTYGLILAIAFLLSGSVLADKYQHHYFYEPIYIPVEQPQATEVTNVTEVVNTTNIENYTGDHCQGVAIAQAGANNQMYMGTSKPQASIGLGECGGDWAGSAMFGIKPCQDCPMLNGNWAFDDNINAFGLGATFIFR